MSKSGILSQVKDDRLKLSLMRCYTIRSHETAHRQDSNGSREQHGTTSTDQLGQRLKGKLLLAPLTKGGNLPFRSVCNLIRLQC